MKSERELWLEKRVEELEEMGRIEHSACEAAMTKMEQAVAVMESKHAERQPTGAALVWAVVAALFWLAVGLSWWLR